MGFFSDFFEDNAGVIMGGGGSAAFGPLGGVLGGGIGGSIEERAARKREQEQWERNLNAQREFAQHGIRWKVADAQAAGIHPLVALGAQPAQFTGYVGGQDSQSSFARYGQDISRAISAGQTPEERNFSNLQLQGAQLELEGKALDNQIKQSQLQKMNAVGPGMPGSSAFISGQGNSGPRVMEKPMERTMSLKGSPHMEPGSLPDVGYVTTKSGLVPVPSQNAKERTEDVMPHEWSHYFRNNVAPNFGGSSSKPPKSALPPGAKDWKWSYSKQEWQPQKAYKVRGGMEYRRDNF